MNSTKQNSSFTLEPIGCIHTPYAQKFAVPRQPGLAPDALSVIEFYPPYNDELSFIGIDGFSHIHVIFLFDRVEYTSFRPKVRPPRLGGNTSVGVFATRSPFRPNRLGLSIVKSIMTNHKCRYGVVNVENGVAFTFEVAKDSGYYDNKQ